ncbi:MAG: hypothetical protein KGI33_03020 [Thaumarchaeota archaeon]|nr:hypothetical protein [Nitrososphaerota archaeon]
MKIKDVLQPELLDNGPQKTIILMSSGTFSERGYVVKKIQLNQYLQRKDPVLGPYSLITVCVETDRGSIETTYDEGYRGENALEEAAAFLTSHLGLSALVLRSIIQFENLSR